MMYDSNGKLCPGAKGGAKLTNGVFAVKLSFKNKTKDLKLMEILKKWIIIYQ